MKRYIRVVKPQEKPETKQDQPAPKKPKKKRQKHRNGFYKSQEWACARYEALKRSSGCCELCGRSSKEGVILNVDHIKPLHKYPQLALDQNNLQVLCGLCNKGKWGGDETDWRDNERYHRPWAGLIEPGPHDYRPED